MKQALILFGCLPSANAAAQQFPLKQTANVDILILLARWRNVIRAARIKAG
jgi:hypothetical protein